MTRGLAALLLAALALGAGRASGQPFDCPEIVQRPGVPADGTPSLVIIIDDIGHRKDTGLASVRLPGRINLAVLPFTPYGKALATMAHAGGKEIMLHAPMSKLGDSEPLGEAGLTTEMQEAEFRAALAAQLQQVPHARGVNNHMGSELTSLPQQMSWLMEELKARELYFIDSRTTPETVAALSAREHAVRHLSRKVFLDNDRGAAAIARQFELAIREAKARGVAVAIGHPYPETMAFLEQALPTLRQRGIHLALASEMVTVTGGADGPQGAAITAGLQP